jgi:hypothetical protein
MAMADRGDRTARRSSRDSRIWVRHNLVVRLFLSLAVVAAVACGSPAAPTEVTGPISEIGRNDEGAITSFTVEEVGTSYRIRIDRTRDYGFDLEHLEAHRVKRLPVRVTLDDRDGTLFAVEILDA